MQKSSFSPRLVVIVPSYNRKGNLQVVVPAVITQLSTEDKVIVVDDGSDDGTFEYIAKTFLELGRVFLIRRDRYGWSPGGARNAGLDMAQELSPHAVLFLDSDCVPLEGCISKHKQVVAGKRVSVGSVKNYGPPVRFDNGEEIHHAYASAGNLCISSEFLDVRFDSKYDGGYGYEDSAYARDLHFLGARFIYNKDAPVYHLPHRTCQVGIERNYQYYYSGGISCS